MNPNTEIQVTADGSPTLYLADIDEHYHSVKGAVTESRHVYVECGLRHRAQSLCQPSSVALRVLEVGYGTGLNAALSAEACHCGVHYIALELHPLSPGALPDYGVEAMATLNAAPWDTPVEISPLFTLEKRNADFLADELPEGIDVVYFDAFAPEKQPEMWSEEALRRVVSVMNPGAVLTTYCAKGAIRRLLQSLGLTVERLPGPPGGKREILRATKNV